MTRVTLTLMMAFAIAGIWLDAPVKASNSSPAGVPNEAMDDFEQVWTRTDEPVAEVVAKRTWIWGPAPFTDVLTEPYAESPGDERQVIYYDKNRMEITSPDADPASPWYVTNGLLAVELTTGQVQLGHNDFKQGLPSEMNVAGDQGFDNGPSYATFGRINGEASRGPPYDHDRTGEIVRGRLERSGRATIDPTLEAYGIELGYFDEVTNANIAAPFWEFMNSTGLV